MIVYDDQYRGITMQLKVLLNRHELVDSATKILVEKINNNQKEYFVLGLSTGSTVLSICEELVRYVQADKVSLKNLIVFYAGEFVGYSKKVQQKYFELLQNNFFSKIDILPQNIYTLNGIAEDLSMECKKYEQKIVELGGIDFFLSSLGSMGELAFNGPGSSLHSRTRLKTLTSETIKADARFFGGDTSKVPSQALTMGISTIYDSKEILIVVYGIQKAFAVRSCLEKSISNMSPASILQMHPKTTFMVDKVAGRLLTTLINE